MLSLNSQLGFLADCTDNDICMVVHTLLKGEFGFKPFVQNCHDFFYKQGYVYIY